MSAHTPGPWMARGPFNEVIGALQEPSFEVSSPDVSVAFVFYPRRDAEAREAARVDAALIAAAPNLLAACEALLDGVESGSVTIDDDEREEALRAAIAKARGK